MAFSAVSVIRGPGEMAAMVVEVTKRIFTRPFQFREFIEQAWFITSVTLMPTILVSIPFGAVISLQVGNLTGNFELSGHHINITCDFPADFSIGRRC